MEDGTRVSAVTSRRISCDAGLVTITHGPDGSVLGGGRRKRTIPPSLRRALEARDRGCRFPGCGLLPVSGVRITVRRRSSCEALGRRRGDQPTESFASVSPPPQSRSRGWRTHLHRCGWAGCVLHAPGENAPGRTTEEGGHECEDGGARAAPGPGTTGVRS